MCLLWLLSLIPLVYLHPLMRKSASCGLPCLIVEYENGKVHLHEVCDMRASVVASPVQMYLLDPIEFVKLVTQEAPAV